MRIQTNANQQTLVTDITVDTLRPHVDPDRFMYVPAGNDWDGPKDKVFGKPLTRQVRGLLKNTVFKVEFEQADHIRLSDKIHVQGSAEIDYLVSDPDVAIVMSHQLDTRVTSRVRSAITDSLSEFDAFDLFSPSKLTKAIDSNFEGQERKKPFGIALTVAAISLTTPLADLNEAHDSELQKTRNAIDIRWLNKNADIEIALKEYEQLILPQARGAIMLEAEKVFRIGQADAQVELFKIQNMLTAIEGMGLKSDPEAVLMYALSKIDPKAGAYVAELARARTQGLNERDRNQILLAYLGRKIPLTSSLPPAVTPTPPTLPSPGTRAIDDPVESAIRSRFSGVTTQRQQLSNDTIRYVVSGLKRWTVRFEMRAGRIVSAAYQAVGGPLTPWPGEMRNPILMLEAISAL